MVVTKLRSSTKAVLLLTLLVGACGGRVHGHSAAETPDDTGSAGAPESTGGSSGTPGGTATVAGGSSSIGAGAVGGTGGSITIDPDGLGGMAAAGRGGATVAIAECGPEWGTPASDPGYRGLRGTFNGQPLAIDGKDVNSRIVFCAADGPGPIPDLNIYFPLPGLSVEVNHSCAARVTSPEDTDWHDLELEIAADVTQPSSNTDPASAPSTPGAIVQPSASGHLTLHGESSDGPFDLDADFYLDVSENDPCIPKPG